MGKLHKIRKAIAANPESFITEYFRRPSGVCFYEYDFKNRCMVYDNTPRPSRDRGHKAYVRSILQKMGYNTR